MDVRVSSGAFLFDQFRLDRRAGGLFRCAPDGNLKPVKLGSRAIDVLCALIDRSGDLISKDEIMAAVWPNTVVNEANLTVQISMLRRVLDQGRAGSCIQTVPGRGYRFVSAVARVDKAPPEACMQAQSDQWSLSPGHRIRETIAGAFPLGALLAPGGWGTPHHSAPPSKLTVNQPAQTSDRRQSVIILPFEPSGPDPGRDDLAAEITREVTNHILKGADGPIVAGTAAQEYQGRPVDPRAIGREHDVHFVLTGNARREDGRLIVTAVLRETAGGGTVWGRPLDVPDGPDALPTLAQVIYENTWQKSVDLEAWHAVHDHPDHLDKRDLILIALSTPLWSPTKANYLKRLSLVDDALALDPNYLRGFERRARLLVEFVLQGYSSDPVADLAMATEAADRALAMDPHSQLSLRVKAAVLRAHGHWIEAEAVQRRVLALRPTESFRHYELGLILMAQGRHQEALVSFLTARRSAGGNNPVYCYDGDIAMANLALGHLAEAMASARLAIGEMPPDIGRSGELPWLALIAATSLSGKEEAARANLQKFLATPRSWHSMTEVLELAAFLANPPLLEGLRCAGMPPE